MDLQSFSLFARLPIEIRRMIWFRAMTPATVYATPENENPRKQENPCLWVCSESRTACLERYQLAPDIGKAYVNFDLDTIYLEFIHDHKFYFPMRQIKSWPQIQRFALDLESLLRFGMPPLLFGLSQCLKLRKVTVVVTSTTVDEVNITNTITKYEDMAGTDKQLYGGQLGQTDILALDFSGQCETISIWWAFTLYKYDVEVRCPEISVVSRPAIT